MKKLFLFLLVLFLSSASRAQHFEGKIVYKNAYKSNLSKLSDEQLNAMMGTTQEYYIKNGDYKSTVDGSTFQWQLYKNRENRLYTKFSNSEILLWNDVAENADEILKAEVNKEVTEILGYLCDELVLTCKSGIQKYYFNTSVSVDPALFVNHKYGNWYDVVSRSHSLPLKMIIENEQFSLESVATEVKAMEIDKAFFDLPPNAKKMKSPY